MSKAPPDTINPIHVSEACWMYAETSGLTVVQEKRSAAGNLIATAQTKVPWRLIDAALERRQKKQR